MNRPASAPTSIAPTFDIRQRGLRDREIARLADDQDPCHRGCACLPPGTVAHAGAAHGITQEAPLRDHVESGVPLAGTNDGSGSFGRGARRAWHHAGHSIEIPPKANCGQPRKTDFALYRECKLGERFIDKFKRDRATSTRYNQLAMTSLVRPRWWAC